VQEIEDLIPRFNSDSGVMHPDGNPNVYIDPSKKLVYYAHVKHSDTVLQRYNIVGLPTVPAPTCPQCIIWSLSDEFVALPIDSLDAWRPATGRD